MFQSEENVKLHNELPLQTNLIYLPNCAADQSRQLMKELCAEVQREPTDERAGPPDKPQRRSPEARHMVMNFKDGRSVND